MRIPRHRPANSLILMTHKLKLLGGLALLLGALPLAQAHVHLQTPTATIGSSYKAILEVGHGCDGSDTTRIRVQIPEGVVAVKPQLKAGWQIETKDGAYAQPETLHGAKIDHGVREISWTGLLPEAFYDEFSFVGTIASSLKPGQTLYFPVVQECKNGVSRWIDTTGKAGVSNPAPSVKLEKAQGHHGAHSH